ncbi:MAG: cobalamin biosynthesis protein CobD [Rhodospirillaceae bacterium]|jgi:adenosylcobinamide-phosphate synthase|nr:cobalamin biosynthesis protein CobD [Rhodospirillaceae bacterium]
MFTFGPLGATQFAHAGLDPLILLLLALLVDAYIGDPALLFRYIKHPVAWIGGLIDTLDQRLNRDKRGNIDRLIRGALVVVFIVALVGVLSTGVAWLTLTHPWGWPIELFLVIALLAGRGLYDHVRAVAVGLGESVEAGREAVSHIVGRDPAGLDEHGVARAGIESLAENFADGVVAPVFWYVLFGFPGLAIYKAVNTMDSMIGHNNTRYRYFGMTAARLDDVLNIIPARLAGLFITLAAVFTPKASPAQALKVMLRDAGKHRSPNAGWSEAPMAGALGLALAGPRRYTDHVVEDPWIGDGRARVTVKDMQLALYLYIVASLINVAFVAALAVVRIGHV